MMIKRALRSLFALCIVWPVIWLWLGLRVKHSERLPRQGPAIIAANHNSHMDVFVLLSLFSLRTQQRVHPVAAADYFLRNRYLAWFMLHILNIIPIRRHGGENNPLAQCRQALRKGDIPILFPEGTRDDPGELAPLKSGIWHLSQSAPQAPIVPVWLSGTEQVMAKGNHIPLPLFVDAAIGEALCFQQDKQLFMDELLQRFLFLQQQNKGNLNHATDPHV